MRLTNSPTDLPVLIITDKKKQKSIKTLTSQLIVDTNRQRLIKNAFLEEMRLGLSPDPERKSSLQMENTYISELIKGTETGSYMALDLGGTNCRVILIQLNKGQIIEEDVSYYDIPTECFTSEGTKLFDFLVTSIDDFMHKKSIKHQHYNLGFTFSFPMIQKSINVGILTSWTKSFNCPGVVGEDVVRLLNEAIARKSTLDITVTAVLNDTTGTLIQGSSLDNRCAIGMILGTGCNACFLEKVENIKKWQGTHTEAEEIVDIEWGSFGDNGILNFLRTRWDDRVDEISLLQKSFTFEKYIGGKYLGDLVREVFVTLAKEGLLCNGSSKLLEAPGSLLTSEVAKMEEESFCGELLYTKEVLTSLGLDGVTDDSARIAQYVAGLVSYRAALLVSLLSSVLMDRMNKPHTTIAIDGSLFKKHPRFRPLMGHLIKSYTPKKPFTLLHAADGSGKGGGLLAAIEERLRKTDL